MAHYRIQVWHRECLWGAFVTEAANGADVVDCLLQLWRTDDGFRCEVAQATEETRLLESGPQGVRLLGVQPQYQVLDWAYRIENGRTG